MNINEILNKYTLGEISLEATNKALKAAGSDYHLDPNRNIITSDERAQTVMGPTPEKTSGWGLMYHGIGCAEKVHVVSGRIVGVDMGAELCEVFIGGKHYWLHGSVLSEKKEV